MDEQALKLLEQVGTTLIDARCELEEIETQTQEMSELHGEITRAHALCWQIIYKFRYGKPADSPLQALGASA